MGLKKICLGVNQWYCWLELHAQYCRSDTVYRFSDLYLVQLSFRISPLICCIYGCLCLTNLDFLLCVVCQFVDKLFFCEFIDDLSCDWFVSSGAVFCFISLVFAIYLLLL
ncbi:hypothetical protein RJT34_22728 [Clitoria ternatea]|uniref:Uncharacterized protein n=1 Tax=Clitoria ternatea TaxID=43366 RepID=A0AAN9FTE8_CLITE